ncbi:MAG: Spx/MgsR family RNA polymerase-binding regulatory protein [Methylococcales bacterium]|nr:Spx/MgsR family RNA polymerase-binding regulatory protein [Methylococcales bacterium]MDD5754380.1 Spx/MgsR family RNA polymerase-binding regulatory protein [Methylococcales bacterium]
MIIYGLTNCDTVKKARLWFDEHQIEYKFHDIRSEGLTLELLKQFAARLEDWQILLNRKGMTWRKLSPEQQQFCTKIETTLPLIAQNRTLMKRPVIDNGTILLVGFDTRMYEKHFL